METDTAVEPRAHLEQLRTALAEHGWPADLVGSARRPALRIRNPGDAGLNVDISSRDGSYCSPQGGAINGASVNEVVAAIQHVLRGTTGAGEGA